MINSPFLCTFVPVYHARGYSYRKIKRATRSGGFSRNIRHKKEGARGSFFFFALGSALVAVVFALAFLLTPMTVIPANDARHKTNNARVCVLFVLCLGLSNDLACLGSMGCLGWMAWLDCLDPCCHPVFLCLECRLDRLDHRCLVSLDLECRSDHPDPLVLDRPDLDLVFPDQGCQLDHPVLDLPDLGLVVPDQECRLECRRW